MSSPPRLVSRVGEQLACSPPRRRLAVAALAAWLALPATAIAEPPPLVEVPRPQLSGLEPAVRDQLTEARHRLDQLLARSDVEPGELGEQLAELGQIYLVYDLTDSAAGALENAARLLPGDHRWPYLLGTLHEHDRRLDDAARWYERARAIDSSYLPTLLRLGDVRLLQGDVAAARALYERALELAPRDAYAHAALGRAAAREQRHAEAARLFEQALELDPRATALHYPAAQAHRAAGDEEAMRRHLERNGQGRVRFADPVAEEVQRQVRGAGAELLLARMAMREGAVDVAEARVRRALELDPENPSAYNNLAVVLEATGRSEEAVEAYTRAARLDPASIGRRFTLARLLERLGRDQQAADELRGVLELAPDFAEGRTELARVLARQGRLEEAVLEYRELLAADPRAASARYELVGVLERLGRGDEARRELEAVLEHAPHFAPAQFAMGSLLAGEGDYEGAITRFARAAELDPDLLEAHQNLAILHGRRGDFAAAARHQERAVDLDPDNVEARLTLATARILGGELAAARRGLEAALERHPSDPRVSDTLARLLAAAPDAAVRDGERALAIAARLLESAPSAQHAETLAMAYAELARFEEAVAMQERVVASLEGAGSGAAGTGSAGSGGAGAGAAGADLVAGARRRLEQYRRGEPARAPWNER